MRVDLVPGSKVRYSGGGTTIVQLMMTDQLKKPFPQIMAETVLRPLGMTTAATSSRCRPSRAAMTASGTRSGGQVVEGRWHIYPEMAAAGLWTTPSDLAKVAIEVSMAHGGKSTPRAVAGDDAPDVDAAGGGLRPRLRGGPEDDAFGHNGADEGFQAYLRAFVGSGRGVVIMANSDNGFAIFNRLADSIGRAYGWKGLEAGDDPPSATADLLTKLQGTERALAWYRAARARRVERLGPSDLNTLGYRLLGAGQIADAVKVFEANVQLYPDDANAYDSLGEGQMAAGNTKAAIENYRKSLAMDPKNENAKKMLLKLEAK